MSRFREPFPFEIGIGRGIHFSCVHTYDKKLTTLATPIHAYSNYLWEKVILSYQKEKKMRLTLILITVDLDILLKPVAFE